jgi:UDP-N-acetylglucosamine 1-carboxyvinyltransferase
MTVWSIRGGPLRGGTVRVAGFKHALVLSVAAASLAEGASVIHNVPLVEDALVLSEILRRLGAGIRLDRGQRSLRIDPRGIEPHPIPTALSTRIHGAVYLIPALLGRLGCVRIAGTGGCRIGSRAAHGARPVEHIISVLERFGATFQQDGECLVGRCSRLRGARIDLTEIGLLDEAGSPTGPLYSGATKTAILAGAVASGQTVIRHAYLKQDVASLVTTLRDTGVDIDVGRHTLRIAGGGAPIAPFTTRLPPDLLEVMTMFSLAAHTGADVIVSGVSLDELRSGLSAELEYLERMGIEVMPGPHGVRVSLPPLLRAVDVRVTPHTIFSDSHPFLALILTSAGGPSRIEERVWANRFDYVSGLRRMGAAIRVVGATATILPRRPMRDGQEVRARDLRSAATLVLAALAIPGRTRVAGVDHLARGYEDFRGCLCSLGADIAAPGAADEEAVPHPPG